jgi:hypothetical protein
VRVFPLLVVLLWCSSASAQDDARSDVFAGLPRGFAFTGYIQPQLVLQSPSSGTTLAQSDGTTNNATFFRLRRARFKLEADPSDFAHVTFEVEPFSKGGPTPAHGTVTRAVEAMGRGKIGDATYELGLGQFNVPFGSEVVEANALRPFIDSSYGMGALFPGDFDIGARATFTLGAFTAVSSILNGVMLAEPTFSMVPDLGHGKDVTLRLLYTIGPLVVGASGYVGSGQLVDPVGLRYKAFHRWATNAEATLDGLAIPIGRTKLVGGFTYATNMDRGLNNAFARPDFPDDLSRAVADKHEMAAMVRLEQDVSRFTFGARWDWYTPDTSLGADDRHTLSTVGVVRFGGGLQTMVEYDLAFDRQHAQNAEIVRATVHTGSVVLQVRF